MNCQIIQRRLLGVEDPEGLPAEVQAHLDGCAACRECQARLVQLEANVRRLPVPPSRARAAFVRQLLETETAPSQSTPVPAVDRSQPRESKPRRVIRRIPQPVATGPSIAVPWRFAVPAAAAAVLLFVFAWSSVRERTAVPAVAERPKPDLLVASLVKHNWALASEQGRQKRAAELQAVADDLNREKQSLEGAFDFNGLVHDISDWCKRVDDTLAAMTGGRGLNTFTSISSPRADNARVQQLRRNRVLIEALVSAAVDMAKEEDRFRRVQICRGLAEGLAAEIETAAGQKDGARIAEMGRHFSELLAFGIADNLKAFRTEIPTGSASEQQIQSLNTSVQNFSEPVESCLRQVLPNTSEELTGEMQEVLRKVEASRLAIEKMAIKT